MPVDQATTARWMGYSTADEMNAEHDSLHAVVAGMLNLPSYALVQAKGIGLNHDKQTLANLEEDAILHLQRYWQHARKYRDA